MTLPSSITPPPKPQTFNADLSMLPPALLPLTQLKRWVVWRWELRASKSGREKWTKPPYQPNTPQ
jgi:primase-polymerase (primpol)-like protein